MKINQEPQSFRPINIRLETHEEAAALWDLVESRAVYMKTHGNELKTVNDLYLQMADYFSDACLLP